MPFPPHRSNSHGRPRSILIEAAACFVATALGSLSPQALSLLDLAPGKPATVLHSATDAKFADRVLVGGLRSLAWETSDVSPAPVFTTFPALPPEIAPAPVGAQKVATAKSAREAPARKGAEPRMAGAIAAPASQEGGAGSETRAVAATEAKTDAAEPVGAWAALTPATVSSKLAPVGQRIWSGARSLGGALSGSLSFMGD